MESKSSFNQVIKWGISFLTVGFAIAFTSLCFWGMSYAVIQINEQLNSYELMFISLILAFFALFVLLVGGIGLVRKLLVDGLTLGMSNATQTSASNAYPPLNFKQTLTAGLDLISIISTIILIPILLWITSTLDMPMSIRFGLWILAIVIFVSGMLGVFVKIVGDSISHASSITGFGIDKADKMVHKKANIQTHTRALSQINQNENPPMVVAPDMNAQVVQSVEVPDFSAQQIEQSRSL